MNYKALEDLVNILVKKAGYNVNEGYTLEDIDLLTKRLGVLKEAKEKLDRKISSDNYVDKDEKAKDLEEKNFIENTIDLLSNQQDNGSLTETEIEKLNEQVKLLDMKIENRTYEDKTSKSIDDLHSRTLDGEIDKVSAIIKEKHTSPSELGLELLDAFKNGRKFEDIKPSFEKLVALATAENKNTVDEIASTNIFELMERYTREKENVNRRLQKDSYSDKEVKTNLDDKKKYHTKRIASYNKTLEAIEARKRELKELIDESKELYTSTRDERIKNEEILNEYTEKLYSSVEMTPYIDEFNKFLDYLKDEILGNKVLEDKYTEDVIAYNDELRTLELNVKNISGKITEEENCIEVVDNKLESLKENCLDRINDELSYLYNSKRLESLTNEQQYFYVNVDTIKTEIANIWNKGNNADMFTSTSYDTYEVDEEVKEEENTYTNESVNYEEPAVVNNYEDDYEVAETIDDLVEDKNDDDSDSTDEFASDVEVYETLE